MATLKEVFETKLADIETRAKAAGTNITQVCRNTRIARATFERWQRDGAPQTITKLDELEAEVARAEAAAQKS